MAQPSRSTKNMCRLVVLVQPEIIEDLNAMVAEAPAGTMNRSRVARGILMRGLKARKDGATRCSEDI